MDGSQDLQCDHTTNSSSHLSLCKHKLTKLPFLFLPIPPTLLATLPWFLLLRVCFCFVSFLGSAYK